MRLNRKPYISLLRGGAVFIISYLLFKLAFLNLVWISAPGDSLFHDLPVWAMQLVAVLAFLFSFNSLMNFFALYDGKERDMALEDGKRGGFLSEIGFVLRTPSFLLECGAAIILAVAFSLFRGFTEIPDMIFFGSEASPALRMLMPIILLVPLLFLISLYARYEVRRYWFYLDRTGRLEILTSKPRFFGRLLFILFGYPTIFPFVPLLVFVAFTFISVFVKLSVVLSVVGVIVGILLILLIIVCISYLSAMNRRKKFLKALLKICEEKEYKISEIKNPYRSFFKHFEGASFTLERGGERYSCRLVSSVRMGVPLYLSSNRHGFFLHRLGFKHHHISLNHNIIWGHEADCRKIAIINPMPKRVVAVAQDGTTRVLSPADMAWDTVIYDAKTLIGVIDRDCLDRVNTPY